MVLTSLAAVALTVSLWVPGTPVVWIAVVGTILAVEEVWAWWAWLQKRGQNYLLPAKSLSTPPIHEKNSSDPFFPSAEVIQQLTRSLAADGTEELTGWLRMAFAAGQRTGSVHVAFCPPCRSCPSYRWNKSRAGGAGEDGPTASLWRQARSETRRGVGRARERAASILGPGGEVGRVMRRRAGATRDDWSPLPLGEG